MRQQDADGDSLVRGSMVGLVCELMILPTGLLTAAILTRSLGLDAYGLIGVVVAAASPVAWMAASALGQRAGVRLVAEAGDPMAAASGVLRASLLIGAVAAAAFALASPLVAGLLGQPGLTGALLIAAGEVLLLPVARAHRDCLAAVRRYSHAALSAAVFHLTRLLAVIALVIVGIGVEAVLGAMVLGRLAEIAWCRRQMAIPLLRRSGLRARSMAGVAGPVFAHEVCWRIANSADILLLSALGAGAAGLSHYGAATVVAQLPGLVLASIVPGMVAALTAAARAGDSGARDEVTLYVLRFVAVFAALLMVGAGGAGTVMGGLFGSDFAPGASVLALLLVGGLGTLVTGVSTALLVCEGRQGLTPRIGAAVLGAALLLLAPAIEAHGAAGAAAAAATSRILGGAIALWLMRRLAVRALSTLGLGLAAGGAGLLVAAGLGRAGLPGLDLAAGAGTALAALWLLGVINRQTTRRIATALLRQPRAGTPAAEGRQDP